MVKLPLDSGMLGYVSEISVSFFFFEGAIRLT